LRQFGLGEEAGFSHAIKSQSLPMILPNGIRANINGFFALGQPNQIETLGITLRCCEFVCSLHAQKPKASGWKNTERGSRTGFCTNLAHGNFAAAAFNEVEFSPLGSLQA
jgi:hypothetical protein